MNPKLMTDPESAALDTRRRRLLFRATHRGTYENDLMIGGFVRADLDALDAAELTPWKPCWNCPTPISPTG